MQKDDFGIGIGSTDGIQGEDVIGRLQNPAVTRRLGIQMPKKAPVEEQRIMMAVTVDPSLVGGNTVRVLEADALKDLGGYVGAFLGGIGADMVKSLQSRRHEVKQPQLHLHPSLAQIERQETAPHGIGIDQLPATRHDIDGILRQQCVQKRTGAARHAGDEDGPADRSSQDLRALLLRNVQTQQIGEAALQIPAGRIAAEEAEIGFFRIGLEQKIERPDKG